MTAVLVEASHPVALIGPARVRHADFEFVASHTSQLVAADGGAQNALSFGRVPDAVIGDFDSFTSSGSVPPERLFRVDEQDSTDFEKCLMRIAAPRILALGFLGRRVDHTLAVLSALVAYPPGVCVLIGAHDVIVHCPPRLRFLAEAGQRVSLFPLLPVAGRSVGLEWPIEGLSFAPGGRVGTSNRATGPVDLELDGSGMLLLLPRSLLTRLLEGLDAG